MKSLHPPKAGMDALKTDLAANRWPSSTIGYILNAVYVHEELLETLRLCERALEERDTEAEAYAAKRAREVIAKIERETQ